MPDLSRITIDPDICHGKPCVRHMRWPVGVFLDLIASGMTTDEILADHPELEQGDIVACLQFARVLASGEPLRGPRDAGALRQAVVSLGCLSPGAERPGDA